VKLIRFGPPGAEKPGMILEDGTRIDVSAFGEDWNESFFGTDGPKRLQAWRFLEGAKAPRVAASERLAPAVCRPSKIVCIGLNYVDHARETKAKVPEEPVIFFKATTAWSGPDDDLVLPRGSVKTDWEVELAVVIGRRVKHARGDVAMAAIAGYSILNDISARDFLADQSFLGPDWVMLKGADGFAPMGPLITPAAFVPDPQALNLSLSVNGVPKQQASTADMAFRVRELIEHLTAFMTLEPGDVIGTGTPPGVGFGRRPQEFLKPGDRMVAEIEGLGQLTTTMIAPQG
jgi:2,4-didehydro-3-deoxy-L-rhamnonate hydrolase